MTHVAFIDSCVFIGYATDFEVTHVACVTFFEQTQYEKYTSESVERELIRKSKRRDVLYNDYSNFLAHGGRCLYIVSPSIYLNQNDERHLNDLRKRLSSIPAHEQLTFLRQFGKILKIRIKKAMGFIREIIPRNNDAYYKDIIRSVIINDDDSWIVNDAFQWSLSRSNVFFITSDSEIYNNRDELLRKLIDFKSLRESPMQIIHVSHHR